MTGFGKAEKKTAFGLVQIEIQAVNSRSLLIKTNLPKSFVPFDLAIKKAISNDIARGTLFVNVTLTSMSQDSIRIKANIPLAKSYQTQVKQLSKQLKLSIRDEDVMAYLLRQGGLIEVSEKTQPLEKPLLQILAGALKGALQTKKLEGLELAKDIVKRLKHIQKNVVKIKAYEKKQPKKVAEKLKNSLKELKVDYNEEKIAKEIALIADKASISEEVTRLHSHIKHMLASISTSTKVAGKKLEFFTAELFRETNTISQKALFQEMIHLCIEMKTQIEKIKEQLANVE